MSAEKSAEFGTFSCLFCGCTRMWIMKMEQNSRKCLQYGGGGRRGRIQCQIMVPKSKRTYSLLLILIDVPPPPHTRRCISWISQGPVPHYNVSRCEVSCGAPLPPVFKVHVLPHPNLASLESSLSWLIVAWSLVPRDLCALCFLHTTFESYLLFSPFPLS